MYCSCNMAAHLIDIFLIKTVLTQLLLFFELQMEIEKQSLLINYHSLSQSLLLHKKVGAKCITQFLSISLML